MGLLYIGTSPSPPHFATDYLLSPLIAPDDLLARFPPLRVLCGEKDPLVDDSVIFSGRVRQVKLKARKCWDKVTQRYKEMKGLDLKRDELVQRILDELEHHPFGRDADEVVRMKILDGMGARI